MKKLFYYLVIFLLLPFAGSAQDVEMADKMREDGKIYIVVAVLVMVLIGILIYLIRLDKKVSSLEKEVDSKKVN